MVKANQASQNKGSKKKLLTKSSSLFKIIRRKNDPPNGNNSSQKLFYTSRRLRKDLGPIKGNHYIDLSYSQMIAALIRPKHWERLEVQSSVELLLGSVLFLLGSIGE